MASLASGRWPNIPVSKSSPSEKPSFSKVQLRPIGDITGPKLQPRTDRDFIPKIEDYNTAFFNQEDFPNPNNTDFSDAWKFEIIDS
ncbi:hypothetical protein TWF970_001369, partial [Orbilia oligospora]